jgi:hypothetical protein
MASSRTRLQLVTLAVKQAGRGAELYDQGKDLLNLVLRKLAIEAKYPALRKIGTVITLSGGSTTAALPTDFGAGSDHIAFGPERSRMEELEAQQFFDQGGIPSTTAGSGRPTAYMVDREAGMYRFNRIPDQSYDFLPVYFKMPADLAANSSSADGQSVWYDNDDTLIELLKTELYVWLNDERENVQRQLAETKVAADRRGMFPISGGSTRLRLSPNVFRRR